MVAKKINTKGKRKNKLELHQRNPHRSRYDFALLADSCPELSDFLLPNQYGNLSVDFSNPEAVKVLNRALLSHFYGIAFWDIPAGYLCPPIPGRADYIHYLADLLADSNQGTIPRGKNVKVLDVGVGANCVYPIIGHQEYGWQFVGSDINPVAIATSSTIVGANSALKDNIKIRLQTDKAHIFSGIWKANERFDLTLCNPPFHASKQAMSGENQRKWRGLKRTDRESSSTLNFGGTNLELWCEGGEVGFISRMIDESAKFADQCYWFTSLVAHKDSLPSVYKTLKKAGARQVKTVDMAQGNKVSRFVAWSFLANDQRDYWQDTYWHK